MAQERVQKILAQAGIASRRKAEELIVEGQVTINGKLAKLGDKADFNKDAIKVQGKLLRTKEPHVYIAFYKPRGVISAMSDPENRPCLADYLTKVKARVYPIGRLDFMSEGLLILTNDGDFAERAQKADSVPRVYHVKVRGKPEASMVKGLEKGARLGNRLVKPHSIRLAEEFTSKIRVEAVFTDPGAVDVKAMFEFRGFLVESIRRVAIGQITLRGLEPGHMRYLKDSQVEAMLSHPELGLRAIPDEGRPLASTGGFAYQEKEREAPVKIRPAKPEARRVVAPVGTRGSSLRDDKPSSARRKPFSARSRPDSESGAVKKRPAKQRRF